MPPWQMLSSVLTTAARAAVVAVADDAAPEEPEEAPLRKLRRAAACRRAPDRRRGTMRAASSLQQRGRRSAALPTPAAARCKALGQRSGVLGDLLGLVAEDCARCAAARRRTPAGHSGRPWESRCRPRTGRASLSRNMVSGQPPCSPKRMQRAHVDGVDVGPLLAVDLDVHEQVVHHAGRRVVLEALVRHDVAPVAGGIADRQQDRLAGALGLGQGLRSPGPPVDGVVLVLQEIGARLLAETVLAHADACGCARGPFVAAAALSMERLTPQRLVETA